MSGLAYITWFPGDFLKSTRGWSVTAKGVYRELLDAQWDQDGLPIDPDELRTLIGATEAEWAEGWKRCQVKFPLAADGKRRNHRLEEHRQKALGKHHERVESGRKGGRSAQAQLKQSSKLSSSIPSSSPSPSPSQSQSQSPSPSAAQACTQSALARENGACAPDVCARARADDDERFNRLKAVYPLFSGRQNWKAAKKACIKLVNTYKATWDELEAAVARLRDFADADGFSGPERVIHVHTFFGAADEPWKQPWELTPIQKLTLEHRSREATDTGDGKTCPKCNNAMRGARCAGCGYSSSPANRAS